MMRPKNYYLEYTTVVQINLYNMARYIEDEVHIESQMDLEQEMCRYNCKTKEELDNLLWYTYGVVLILDYEEK